MSLRLRTVPSPRSAPRSASRSAAPSAGTGPRDVEALEEVLKALDGAHTTREIHHAIVHTLTSALGLDYGAVWLPAPDDHYVLVDQSGPFSGQIAAGWNDQLLPADGGYGGQAIRTRQPVLVDEHTSTAGCLRWELAQRAGARHGCLLPIIWDGEVVALHEYYNQTELPFFGVRTEKWRALARIAAHASQRSLATAALRENLDDRVAVTTVVTEIGNAPNEQAALQTALETVRASFGWAYGSFWRLDETDHVLKFQVESGSAGAEFRKVTLEASFAEGTGLSGRAWRARDLVFVPDLGELTDCVRAPAAQRAGVRSGVCFPVMSGDRVIGTMDFFALETIELSESRASALRNVQQLVSQRLHVLRREDADAAKSRELLDTVFRLREAAADASRVADEAVAQASTMTDEVRALGDASSAVGEVIKIISQIADQTNLLALNASIEAARVGEVGRGFAVVAGEVKELARATASATQRVAQHIAGLRSSSTSVSDGIHSTGEIIGQLDAVQSRIGEVLEEQARMADAFHDR